LSIYYFVRHGTTDWMERNYLHGITDIPLNEKGFRQAQKTARVFESVKTDQIFTSPLSRALQTAQCIGDGLGLSPTIMEDLRELNFGWMEGKKIRDDYDEKVPPIIWTCDHYWMSFIRGISGESRTRFSSRVMKSWFSIQEQTTGKNCVIVTHSAVLNTILSQCFKLEPPKGRTYYPVHPCGITKVEVDEIGKPNLISLDDHAHLLEWYPNDD
jgi:broad specificity phosphatase PhoE